MDDLPLDLNSLRFTKLPSKSLKASQDLIAGIKNVERRSFPTNEAFEFDNELGKRTTSLYCAHDENAKLYGYVVYVRSKLVTRIHKVCVLEKYRRKGIGKWMLSLVLQELRKGAAEKVDLWVDTAREPARRLYHSCGLQEKEIVQNYYSAGRDGVRMEIHYEVPNESVVCIQKKVLGSCKSKTH